ncbi:MAG: DUF4114 domain-containing protein [Gammaproteobacteria bacterium]
MTCNTCWEKALVWLYSISSRAGMCLGLAGLTLVSAQAQALPSLYDITGISGTEVYQDSGSSAARLSDTDGGYDDATAFLFFELAGFRDSNSFGIYDYSINSSGDILLGDTLEVFNGKASPITSATLAFDLSAGTVKHKGTNATRNIGDTFGFYLTTPQSTYYSHSLLNPDGFDHLLMFDTGDNSVGTLLGSDLVLAWEDWLFGGDRDYNDMVVGITDVRPVPEPSALALVGLGLIVLIARIRAPISA